MRSTAGSRDLSSQGRPLDGKWSRGQGPMDAPRDHQLSILYRWVKIRIVESAPRGPPAADATSAVSRAGTKYDPTTMTFLFPW
jgi:hypothetical protein